MAVTMMSNVVNPEVMGDMISAKVEAMLKVTKYAKVDTTLQGVAGDTKTVPSWNYIGEAVDVAEGAEVDLTAMTASTKTFTIKKAMKAVALTQEAVNSAHGNIIGETETQLAKAIAGKVDSDVLAALLTATAASGDGSKAISYEGIVDAVGVFNEEEITEKVMFVNPAQVTTLRKDANFISADKYNFNVVATGEIGTIAGVHIVPSKKIVASGDKFTCPIVKLEPASPETEYTEDELPAVTIFLKKDIQTDADWIPRKQQHEITTAKYYGVALTNEAKVVKAVFDATPAV
jgi:N4-gp56 family major capsid protein